MSATATMSRVLKDSDYKAATQSATVPAFDGLSKDWTKRQQQHADEVASAIGQLAQFEEQLTDALETAEHGEIGSVSNLALFGQSEVGEVAQQLVRLWVERRQLCLDAYEELKPLAAKAKKRVAETLSKVIADLESIGQGVEATAAGATGFPSAKTVAVRQLEQLAKLNVRYRKTDGIHKHHEAQKQSASSLAHGSADGEAAARRFLAKVARNIVH